MNTSRSDKKDVRSGVEMYDQPVECSTASLKEMLALLDEDFEATRLVARVRIPSPILAAFLPITLTPPYQDELAKLLIEEEELQTYNTNLEVCHELIMPAGMVCCNEEAEPNSGHGRGKRRL